MVLTEFLLCILYGEFPVCFVPFPHQTYSSTESVVRLSSLTELCNGSTFCYFGVYHFANFALAKTGVLQTILTQGL